MAHEILTLTGTSPEASREYVVEYVESSDEHGRICRDVTYAFHAKSFLPCIKPETIADLQEELNRSFRI